MRSQRRNQTTAPDGERAEFVDLLKEELRLKKQDSVFERDIARRASIDASTLSLIKERKRIKNPSWELRLRLATALRHDLSSATELATKFFAASPSTNPEEGWEEKVQQWKVAALQSEIKSIRFGLPLFFDTAPFLVADRNKYFEQLGLNISFEYVKWNKVLNYFEDVPKGHPDLVSLTVCNRNSIEDDNKNDEIAFCFPLAIAKPKSFAFWMYDNQIPKGANSTETIKNVFEKFQHMKHGRPKIIVSGADMKKGVVRMFEKFAQQTVKEDWFLFLDQFDSITVFLSEAGDGFVGGVPQLMRIPNQSTIQCLMTGDEIGLDRQFNGLACPRHELDKPATRKMIGQILWCWYRALEHIEQNLDSDAEFIAAKLNVHGDKANPYHPDDFKRFWKSTEYFELPKNPNAMRKSIELDRSYPHKFYDESNSLNVTVKEIETLLSTPNQEYVEN